MLSLALCRWILRGLASSVLVWTVWIGLLCAQPLLEGIALLPASQTWVEGVASWAYPAGLLGALLAMIRLSSGAPFLARLPPGTRFRGALGALLAGALYMQLPTLVGALGAGASPAALARALPAMLTADLSTAGVALLLLARASAIPFQASLFLSVFWLVPALIPAERPFLLVRAYLDAGATLRAGAHALPPAAVAVALATLVAAGLLHTRPRRAPSR